MRRKGLMNDILPMAVPFLWFCTSPILAAGCWRGMLAALNPMRPITQPTISFQSVQLVSSETIPL
jgi:hypothetical protein